MTKATNPPPKRQTFRFKCGKCGERGMAFLGHYDKAECRCGQVFWALQPKRNGPLKLVNHPGHHG